MCDNEFKAIVLAAGTGSRMREITHSKPKCLLPVGNLPVIWYPLSMLEKAGFSAATVVVLEEEQNDIKRTLDKLDLKLSLKFVSIKRDDDLGTVDALRKVSKSGELGKDVVIVSSDLVTDKPLENVFNLYRRHEASLVALFFPSVTDPAPGSIPGPKSKSKPERDLVGLDPVTSRLVLLSSASDFEESVDLRMRLLRKHNRVEIHSRLTDAHLYVISKHLWRYITCDDNQDSTLKGETLPFIVKQQMSRQNKWHEKMDDNEKGEREDELVMKTALFKCIPHDDLQLGVEQISSWTDHPCSVNGPYHGDRLRCFAMVTKPPTTSFRVNTLPIYWEVNRQILKSEKWCQLTGGRDLVRIDPTSTLKTKKLEACLVGAGSQVLEGVKMERTSLGANCTVQTGATLTDCTLMDNVTVGENVTLVNCLICEKGVVEKGANLKSCLVGFNYTVAEGSSHEFEILSKVIMET